MAVCYKCKTEYSGNFCPSCGAPAQAGPTPVPTAPVYTNVTVAPSPAHTTSIMGWIGWLLLISFLPIIGLIIMALAPQDESVKNYAKAGLILTVIAGIIALIIFGLFFFGLMAASSN